MRLRVPNQRNEKRKRRMGSQEQEEKWGLNKRNSCHLPTLCTWIVCHILYLLYLVAVVLMTLPS